LGGKQPISNNFNANAYGNPGQSGGLNRGGGDGSWQNGKHISGPVNERLKLELFGVAHDPSKQQTGINFDKYDDIPVEASGVNVPDPIDTFTNPPLDDHLLQNIDYAHYKVPTPVQKYSIPIVMGGRDLMACAQTGSGKTGGFLFPILSQAFIHGPTATPAGSGANFGRSRKAYPTSLILAPTRELVSQIFEESRKFAFRSWVRPCVVYGGADISSQLRQIESTYFYLASYDFFFCVPLIKSTASAVRSSRLAETPLILQNFIFHQTTRRHSTYAVRSTSFTATRLSPQDTRYDFHQNQSRSKFAYVEFLSSQRARFYSFYIDSSLQCHVATSSTSLLPVTAMKSV
jgi:hypothetical protein